MSAEGSKPATQAIEPALLDFASGLAHELSNALNSVGLYADMARVMTERGETENTLKVLAGLQREFRRSIDLMNALRRFAGSPNRLCTETTLVAAVLAEASASVCSLIDAEPGRIQIENANPAIELQLDAEAMTHVLVELARNALEADASVVTYRVENGGDGVTIEVEDDGTGVDPDLEPRLFQMFAGTRRSEGHLGLGLWTARRICAAQGATVGLVSTSPKGSHFRLCFQH